MWSQGIEQEKFLENFNILGRFHLCCIEVVRRRAEGLVKVLQVFKNEEVSGYRALQVNTGKFGSGVSLSIRRRVVVFICRKIILMKVG